MNILRHIQKIMQDDGIVVPIKLAKRPNSPNEVIVLRQTGGIEPDANATAKEIQEPTVQAYIRSGHFDDGMQILEDVRSALHQDIERTLTVDGNTIRFLYILAISEGGHLGADETDREEFSINFKVKCHAN